MPSLRGWRRRGGGRQASGQRPRPSRAGAAARVEDFYVPVARALVARLRAPTAEWTQAWEPDRTALPYNVKTGKTYRGGNMLWLQGEGLRRGHADERWGTYKQVKSLGGQVRKGERGAAILFYQVERQVPRRGADGRPVLDAQGRPVTEARRLRCPRVFRYTVFNAEQCDGLPPRPRRAGRHRWAAHDLAERLLARTGAVIEHTAEGKATYDYPRDRIVMPFREQYTSDRGFYQSALHELGHWTGHASRLDRRVLVEGMARGMGSAQYAREELRAEICSMILGDRLAIGHDLERNASYCAAWARNLEEDPMEVYAAARDAQGMADYLLDRLPEKDREGLRERDAERIAGGLGAGAPAPREAPAPPGRLFAVPPPAPGPLFAAPGPAQAAAPGRAARALERSRAAGGGPALAR